MINDPDFTTLDKLQPAGGTFRNGRRTPETIYTSLDDNLDDRSTNFPVTLVHDVELAKFFVDAANEKLARMRRTADPEAWLADQLAQLIVPSQARFTAVERIAQEYGEMCAARATEGLENVVTEHGEAFKSGDVKVWDVSAADIYPIHSRIRNHHRQGGKVLRRKVIVVEDWKQI